MSTGGHNTAIIKQNGLYNLWNHTMCVWCSSAICFSTGIAAQIHRRTDTPELQKPETHFQKWRPRGLHAFRHLLGSGLQMPPLAVKSWPERQRKRRNATSFEEWVQPVRQAQHSKCRERSPSWHWNRQKCAESLLLCTPLETARPTLFGDQPDRTRRLPHRKKSSPSRVQHLQWLEENGFHCERSTLAHQTQGLLSAGWWLQIHPNLLQSVIFKCCVFYL